MAYSENPLTRAYWMGSVDPRPLALFRIGFGLIILHDLVDLTHDFRAFLTDEGMLPRGVEHVPFGWSVFDLVGSPLATGLLFTLGVLAVIAFTVGFQTRVATFLSWAFLASLHNRNVFITDAGDDLARIMLFWSMFADLGECFSVDASRRGGAPRPAHAIGLRVMQWHLAVLYAVTALLKYRQGWMHGEAIYQALQLDGFVRPPGVLLGKSVLLCKLATWAVPAMELMFPIAFASPVLTPWARALTIACGLGVQLGIFASMRVGIFTQLMLWAMVLYALPAWLDRAETWARGRIARAQKALPFSEASLVNSDLPHSTVRNVFAVLVGLQFLFTAWDPFLNNRLPLPRAIKDERSWLQLRQPMDLFGVIYEVPNWSALGHLDDGTVVDVLATVAPGANEKPRFHYSRWNKFTYKWIERPYHLPELGAFFCRAYDAESGQRLKTFALVNDPHMPALPGRTSPPPTHRELLAYDCEAPPERAVLAANPPMPPP